MTPFASGIVTGVELERRQMFRYYSGSTPVINLNTYSYRTVILTGIEPVSISVMPGGEPVPPWGETSTPVL